MLFFCVFPINFFFFLCSFCSGNIRLEDGKPSDVWYTSCEDLLFSRFYNSDFRAYNVGDLRVSVILSKYIPSLLFTINKYYLIRRLTLLRNLILNILIQLSLMIIFQRYIV